MVDMNSYDMNSHDKNSYDVNSYDIMNSSVCCLPYPQNHITGNAPYGTGNAVHTGNVSCPYQYCTPLYFTFFLANPLRYVPIQSTGTVITM